MLQDFQLREKETGEILTRKIRMLFLSLKQIPERWEECENELQRQLYLIKNMEKLDKNSVPYKDGGYDDLFRAAESADIVGEEMVRYSESLDRLRSYQAGVDYAAEKSRLEGIQEGVKKVAMRLIKSGMDDMLIADMTDLSLEQIKRLRAR